MTGPVPGPRFRGPVSPVGGLCRHRHHRRDQDLNQDVIVPSTAAAYVQVLVRAMLLVTRSASTALGSARFGFQGNWRPSCLAFKVRFS